MKVALSTMMSAWITDGQIRITQKNKICRVARRQNLIMAPPIASLLFDKSWRENIAGLAFAKSNQEKMQDCIVDLIKLYWVANL